MLTGAHSTEAGIVPLGAATAQARRTSLRAEDWAYPQPSPQKEKRMAMMPVLEDLDRCKIALQYVAEMQADSLTTVLELLLERLDDAIGQVHAQVRQCTCQAHAPRRATAGPAHPGVLTMLPACRETPRCPPPVAPEELPTEDDGQAPRNHEA